MIYHVDLFMCSETGRSISRLVDVCGTSDDVFRATLVNVPVGRHPVNNSQVSANITFDIGADDIVGAFDVFEKVAGASVRRAQSEFQKKHGLFDPRKHGSIMRNGS